MVEKTNKNKRGKKWVVRYYEKSGMITQNNFRIKKTVDNISELCKKKKKNREKRLTITHTKQNKNRKTWYIT